MLNRGKSGRGPKSLHSDSKQRVASHGMFGMASMLSTEAVMTDLRSPRYVQNEGKHVTTERSNA